MSVEDIVKGAHKKFGGESLFLLGGNHKVKVASVKTGIPNLDIALGIGGIPRGRIVEFYGNESCGKTTLALQTIGNFQAQGLDAAFIDAEHALDMTWAAKLGVQVDKLLFNQPDCGEDALEMALYLVDNGLDIVVIDSVAALTPRAEIEGDMGEVHVGRQARLMGQGCRKISAKAKKAGTTIIFINQIRMKIGVLFGSPETTPGGNALKFYASIRLQMSRLVPNKDEDFEGEEAIMQTVKIKVVKNKLAPPFKLAETKLVWKDGFEGFNLSYNIFQGLFSTGVITKKKNTYYYEGEKIDIGKKKTMQWLKEMDKEELDILYGKVLEKLSPKESKKKKKRKKKRKGKK